MVFRKRTLGATLVLLLLMNLLSGCIATDYRSGHDVVEVSALEPLLSDPQVVVIDARDAEDYTKGHLKGAVSLPPSALGVDEPVAGLIAPQELVESVLGAKGISNTSKIYIYDNKGGVYAARVWWILKVYGHDNAFVINNGESAIVKSGLELSADVPTREATTYTAKSLDGELCASYADVKAAIDGSQPAKIIDVRSKAEFDEGAIPNAILYPHTNNLFDDGTFRPAGHILMNYKDLGLKVDDPIILYCKTSFRATQTALLLKEAGFTHVKVYDGAWSEWSTLEAPAEKPEEEVAPTTLDAS